jgi:acyl-CoA thioester hydrolase
VDPFAHANHTSFLGWFEALRNLYLEAAGLPRLSIGTPGPVLMTLAVRYLRPLAYHEPVFVTARVKSMRRTSFVMDYAACADVEHGAGCACSCEAVIVLVVNATGEKAAIPDAVRAAFRDLDAPAET